MKLILIIEPNERDDEKLVITQMFQNDVDVMHQWQFLMRKFPNIHVEALRLSPTRLVLKLDTP